MTDRARNFKGNALLVLAALIWGVAFVAQDKAAENVPPFALNGIRFLIGSAVLIPLIAFLRKNTGKALF